jgi:hypothetical protein
MSWYAQKGVTSDNAPRWLSGRLQRPALTRADPEDRGTPGQMRQSQRSLRDQHGMASDRFLTTPL